MKCREWEIFYCSHDDEKADIYCEKVAGPKPKRPERILVIEKVAYNNLQDKFDKAVEALRIVKAAFERDYCNTKAIEADYEDEHKLVTDTLSELQLTFACLR